MLEDLPQDEEGAMQLGWAVHWDTEDGSMPSGEDFMSDAQATMAMLLAALEKAVGKSQSPLPEEGKILLPH